LAEWQFQWSPDPENLERAFALEQKALALDDSLPMAHWQLSNVYLAKKQYDQAQTEAERAVAVDPNYADGYLQLGGLLNIAGRPQETLGVMEKALRLNPHAPVYYLWTLGTAYWLMGRNREAITIGKQAVARNPNFRPAHGLLAVTYSELGREAEARAEAAEMLRISPDLSLEFVRKNLLIYKDPAVNERFLAGLRKAGLK
jgi:adenylate cyclase